MSGPPAESEYAVDPVVVATIKPSCSIVIEQLAIYPGIKLHQAPGLSTRKGDFIERSKALFLTIGRVMVARNCIRLISV